MRALLIASALLATALISAFLAGNNSRLAASSGVVVGAGLIILGAVSVIGMLIGHARWARRLGIGLAGVSLAISILAEHPVLFIAGVSGAGLVLVGLIGPGMRGTVRDLPPALGPPPEAVVLPLLLVAAPMVVAVTSPDGLGLVEAGAVAVSWISAALYTKAGPGAMWLVRILAPAALAAAGISRWPTGLATLLVSGLVAGLAWRSNTLVAVRPLVRTGTGVPILPELVSEELLGSAGYDRRGRPTQPPP